MKSTFDTAAYGGDGWQPRQRAHAEEIGTVWARCGVDNEWGALESVLLHRPGAELSAAAADPNRAQMLSAVDVGRARAEHDEMAQRYRENGVAVHLLHPAGRVAPNQMFCADLFAMTPQGAILGRPASTVRSGEEREVARRLAELGVPILKTLTGHGTFEGADLMWIDRGRALIGQGLRTNREAAVRIGALLAEMGAEVVAVDLPFGSMHLMGLLRIVDRQLAIAWPRRTPYAAVTALRDAGYTVVFVPEGEETRHRRAFNFVTLGPRRILMTEGTPDTRAFYESHGIECITTPASELGKAAGAIGCLTGVLSRQRPV